MNIRTEGDRTVIAMKPGEELPCINLSRTQPRGYVLKPDISTELSGHFEMKITKKQRRKILMRMLCKGDYNAMVLREDGHLGPDNCWKK